MQLNFYKDWEKIIKLETECKFKAK